MQALRNHTRTLVGALAIVLALVLLTRTMPPVVTATPGQDSPVSTQATTFPANNVGPVPDGFFPSYPYCISPLNITFTVTGISAPLTDVEVSFTMSPPHTQVGDLTATLISPSNVKNRVLFSRTGKVPGVPFGDDSNLAGQYTFRDSGTNRPHWWFSAASALTTDDVVATGVYRTVAAGPGPPNPLITSLTGDFSELSTYQINGTWTLRMCDTRRTNTGSVSAASLKLTGPCKTCSSCKLLSDFDGDGINDLAVVRPSTPFATWISQDSSPPGTNRMRVFGLPTDRIVPGDYDGDGVTDIAIFTQGQPGWFIVYSAGTVIYPNPPFGVAGDIPVPRDYDGDGRTDLATWHPNPGTWTIFKSTGGPPLIVTPTFAQAGDIPVPEDYDGDCKADLAVWRNGTWFIINSSNNSTVTFNLGATGDKLVPADYDGDGTIDIAVWTPSTGVWHIRPSSGIPDIFQTFGMLGDKPIPACSDCDGRAVVAIYRPSTGTFFKYNCQTGGIVATVFGLPGDIPVLGAYILP